MFLTYVRNVLDTLDGLTTKQLIRRFVDDGYNPLEVQPLLEQYLYEGKIRIGKGLRLFAR